MTDFSLEHLAETIAERARSGDASSYTAKLARDGVFVCAKKFGEEAVEAALAGVQGDAAELTREAADVLYHLLVLLEVSGVPFSAVKAELGRRTCQSGLEEKAARDMGKV
ncbi:MAG TPA: phosphoribosyl-ATP diphosphatase [Afifellaceae bacterium]|nr:phosphoribosyl-ATP diphosphatase [Afifellaceae bacterium]